MAPMERGRLFVLRDPVSVQGALPSAYRALCHAPNGPHHEPLPLLLYLHGAGESGDDLWQLATELSATGTPPFELHAGRAVAALAAQFVVVAPQAAEGEGWPPARVAAFLQHLLASTGSGLPPIDATRCYVAGNSMGGSGALNAGGTGCFAAVVAVAPGAADRTAESTLRLRGVPCWLFHGANDSVLPARHTDRTVERLRALSGDELVRYTRYDSAPDPPGHPDCAGHAACIPAFATSELYTWLLRHARRGPRLDALPHELLSAATRHLAAADALALAASSRTLQLATQAALDARRRAAAAAVHNACAAAAPAAPPCLACCAAGARAAPPCARLAAQLAAGRGVCVGGGGGGGALGRDGACVLLAWLRAARRGGDHPPLRRLELDGAGLGCDGAAALARGLPAAAPELLSLSLSRNRIGDAGAGALAALVARGGLPRLRALEMEENCYGGVGRSALRRACRARGIEVAVVSTIENESLFE